MICFISTDWYHKQCIDEKGGMPDLGLFSAFACKSCVGDHKILLFYSNLCVEPTATAAVTATTTSETTEVQDQEKDQEKAEKPAVVVCVSTLRNADQGQGNFIHLK